MTNAMADVSIGGSLAEPSGANPEGQTADQAAAATLDSSGDTAMTNLAEQVAMNCGDFGSAAATQPTWAKTAAVGRSTCE